MDVREYIKNNILLFDGAMGTMLQQKGLKIGENPEVFGFKNPEKLMDIYRDCILLELKQCEHMLYTMFRQADIQFSQEDKMQLVLEDSVIARSKEDELICILDKVINERCGFKVKFEVLYKE